MKNQRIAIYMRVSTDKQDCDMQLNEIKKWLAIHPYTDVSYFKDQGISGVNSQRPEYRRLLRQAKGRKFDIVLVYSIDRLSRTASEAIQTILMLDHIGIDFVSLCQPIFATPNNPFRRTMMMLFAELAELERAVLIRRINDGIAAAKARGVQLGAPSKTNATMRLKIHSLRLEKFSLREIAHIMGLSTATIHKILKAEKERQAHILGAIPSE